MAARVLGPLLSTPRDINRYLAALPASLRMIGEEVALVDVLALEAIRLRLPDVFAQLGPMSRALTDVGMITSQTPGWQAEVDAFIQSAGENAAVVSDLCRLLFPATERYLGSNTTYPSNWLPIWRKNRRVANPDVLAIYLSKQLPPGTVPAATVEMAVLAMAHKELFQAVVDNLSADDLDDFLARLAGYEDDVAPDAVLPGCTVLLGLYPRLRSQSKGFLDVGPEIAVDRVVLQLLRRVDDEAERTKIVEESVHRRCGLHRADPAVAPGRAAAESGDGAAHPRRRVRPALPAGLPRAPPRQRGASRGRARPAAAPGHGAGGRPGRPRGHRSPPPGRRRRRRAAAVRTSSESGPGGGERGGADRAGTALGAPWHRGRRRQGDHSPGGPGGGRCADDEAAMAVVALARKYLTGWRPSEFPFGSPEPVIRQAINHPHMFFSPSVIGGGWPALLIRAVTTYEVDPAWAARADVSGAEFHHRLTAFLTAFRWPARSPRSPRPATFPPTRATGNRIRTPTSSPRRAVQRLILGPADQPAAVLRYAVFLPGNSGPMKLITDIAVSPGEATDAKWGQLGLEEIRDTLVAAIEAAGGPGSRRAAALDLLRGDATPDRHRAVSMVGAGPVRWPALDAEQHDRPGRARHAGSYGLARAPGHVRRRR